VTTYFSLNRAGIHALKRAVVNHGAGGAEIAALVRLESDVATQTDVERLAPLAKLADLSWSELFPEVFPNPYEAERETGRKLAAALCDYLEGNDDYPRTARTAEVLNDLLCDIDRTCTPLEDQLFRRMSDCRTKLLRIVRGES
jgi:hypothetical protein